jgi:hypothetical protein
MHPLPSTVNRTGFFLLEIMCEKSKQDKPWCAQDIWMLCFSHMLGGWHDGICLQPLLVRVLCLLDFNIDWKVISYFFPSNVHACTSLDWRHLFTQWTFALVSKHSPVYHIRIFPSQNCQFFTFFTVDFLSLWRCKTSDNMAAYFPV